MSDGGRVRIYLEWWELVVHSWDLSVMFSYFQFTAVNLLLNSLRPRPNRRHFADDIFRCIFENENEWISSRISLKFVPKVRINNIPALVQIMAWRRQGDKPLSEPMMVSLLTHICVTRPQWVKASKTVCQFYFQEFTVVIMKAAYSPLHAVTVKITGPRTAAGKTHVGPVNHYIIMIKIRKIKPNSRLVQQKPESFHSDCACQFCLDQIYVFDSCTTWVLLCFVYL